jgi:hypothetical protein
MTVTAARIGPSIPSIVHAWGGSRWVMREVIDRFAKPICRVLWQRSPTAGLP